MVTRHEQDILDGNIASKTFDEVALGYDEDTAVKEAERCLNCKHKPCVSGCPVNIHIPEFLSQVKNRDFVGAYNTIKKSNNFPAICGRVCPQENQCEKVCVRNKAGGAVAIGTLERFVADWAYKNLKEEKHTIEGNGMKVAVVGSGPAGLSCACELAKNGYTVTVFEALHELGGVLNYGIPEFRLKKELVEKEIQGAVDLGVTFKTNVLIGRTLTIDDLLQKYNAVFIANGAGLPVFLNIKGENLNGVYSANEYLTRVNLMKAYEDDCTTPVLKKKNVVVVGGGNVAMDAARVARRLGAEVTVVYRRGREEMPARRDEVHHAELEGIKFAFLTNPVEIVGKNEVEGMKCIKMQLGEPDKDGRRSPIPIQGSEYIIACEEVIVALGTRPNPIIRNTTPDIKFNEKGTIWTDSELRTSKKFIYAGGDAQTGAATVILAMGAGKIAAKTIMEDLKQVK